MELILVHKVKLTSGASKNTWAGEQFTERVVFAQKLKNLNIITKTNVAVAFESYRNLYKLEEEKK